MPLVGKLSYKSVLRLGKWLGLLMLKVAKRRRDIAQRNIELCFPELSATEQQKLLRENLIATGQGLVEAGFIWTVPGERLLEISSLYGEEHLLKAKESGKGIILLAFHLTSLEMGGNCLANYYPMAAMYRQHRNPDFERAMTEGRLRHVSRVIERQDVRNMLKALKSGETIWYAADQDYGAKHSVFAPFFGIQAASITATIRFAKMTNARVVPMTHYRDQKNGHFHIRLHPEMTDFAKLDEQQAAETVNTFLENYLRGHPTDYMWVHRRFKTRPEGEAGFYIPKSILKMRRMLPKQFNKQMDGAEILEGSDDRPEFIRLKNGRLMRFFYNVRWYTPSPAKAFAREMRDTDSELATTLQLFKYPEKGIELALYIPEQPATDDDQ